MANAEYQHENGSLLKQVASASDCSFKNDRQKRPGRCIWIPLYIVVDVLFKIQGVWPFMLNTNGHDITLH